jgi:hypothetical protein
MADEVKCCTDQGNPGTLPTNPNNPISPGRFTSHMSLLTTITCLAFATKHSHFTISFLTLPHNILPYLTLPYLPFPSLTFPYITFPHQVPHRRIAMGFRAATANTTSQVQPGRNRSLYFNLFFPCRGLLSFPRSLHLPFSFSNSFSLSLFFLSLICQRRVRGCDRLCRGHVLRRQSDVRWL